MIMNNETRIEIASKNKTLDQSLAVFQINRIKRDENDPVRPHPLGPPPPQHGVKPNSTTRSPRLLKNSKPRTAHTTSNHLNLSKRHQKTHQTPHPTRLRQQNQTAYQPHNHPDLFFPRREGPLDLFLFPKRRVELGLARECVSVRSGWEETFGGKGEGEEVRRVV
jgi:hypothetical protein